MAKPVSKLGWRIVGSVAAAVAGSLSSKLITNAYRQIRKNDPPADPTNPHTSWGDAVAWAVVSGVAIGLGRVLAARAAASAWERAVGSLPPGMDETL